MILGSRRGLRRADRRRRLIGSPDAPLAPRRVRQGAGERVLNTNAPQREPSLGGSCGTGDGSWSSRQSASIRSQYNRFMLRLNSSHYKGAGPLHAASSCASRPVGLATSFPSCANGCARFTHPAQPFAHETGPARLTTARGAGSTVRRAARRSRSRTDRLRSAAAHHPAAPLRRRSARRSVACS